MAFDYTTNLNAVVQALKDYNTTTAGTGLSNGLTVHIDNANIIASDPDIDITAQRADRLPSIYVMISGKEEEPDTIGRTGGTKVMKRAVVEYEIFGIYGKSGGLAEYSSLLTDVYKMAGNIEAAFQLEVKLSNTALWCNPKTTDFSGAEPIGEGFAKALLIKLEAVYLFR